MRPCQISGDVQHAFQLYDELLASGQPPDLTLYNTLITVCATAKDFDKAEDMFNEMRDKVSGRPGSCCIIESTDTRNVNP